LKEEWERRINEGAAQGILYVLMYFLSLQGNVSPLKSSEGENDATRILMY
jgi:hypothetical protein